MVFYNGREERPEKEILKLSDLYQKPIDVPQMELVCEVYNINNNKPHYFLKKCAILSEYAVFIEKIREYEHEGYEKPIEEAIEWCIKNHILEDFLLARKSEVLKAMTIDMTFEHREEIIRREEREEGKAESTEKAVYHMLLKNYPDSEIMEITECSKETIDKVRFKTFGGENGNSCKRLSAGR